MMLIVSAGTFFFFAVPVQIVLAVSQELNLDAVPDPQVTPMPSMFTLFLKLMVSLVIIVGLTYLTMKLLRKNMKVLSRGVSIEVLDQYAFSMNKGVYITQIAGKVYVLGVTDHNISLISEITDQSVIDELVAKAREKEMEPIIPPSILERILPGLSKRPDTGNHSFNQHIQSQIKKLQSMVEQRAGNSRKDDRND